PGGQGRPLLDLSSGYVQRALDKFPRQGDRDPWLVQQDYLRHRIATPPPGGQGRPLLDLSSGYVQRALDKFPRQGDRDPWLVRQNYLRDVIATPRADVTPDMAFPPRPAPVRRPPRHGLPPPTPPRPLGGDRVMTPYHFGGRTAVLTGAASGI